MVYGVHKMNISELCQSNASGEDLKSLLGIMIFR